MIDLPQDSYVSQRIRPLHPLWAALFIALLVIAQPLSAQWPGVVDGSFPADAKPVPCVDRELPLVSGPINGTSGYGELRRTSIIYGEACSTGCRFRDMASQPSMSCPPTPVRPQDPFGGAPVYDNPWDNLENNPGLGPPSDGSSPPSWRNDGNACCVQYSFTLNGRAVMTTGYGSCDQGVCKPFPSPSPTARATISTPSPGSSTSRGNQGQMPTQDLDRCNPSLEVSPSTVTFSPLQNDVLTASIQDTAGCSPTQLRSAAIFWRRNATQSTPPAILGRGDSYQLTNKDSSGTYFAELRISTGSGVRWIRSQNETSVTVPLPGTLTLTQDLVDITADEGTYVLFAPTFTGLGASGTIRWYFTPLSSTNTREVGTGPRYEITSALATHRGTYFAVARNSSGELATSRVRLLISPPGTGFGRPARSPGSSDDDVSGIISWDGANLQPDGATEFEPVLESNAGTARELMLYNPLKIPLSAQVSVRGDFTISPFGQKVDFAARPTPVPSATPIADAPKSTWSARLAPGTGVSISIAPRASRVGQNQGTLSVTLGTLSLTHNLRVQVDPVPGWIEYFLEGNLVPLMRGGAVNLGAIPTSRRDLKVKLYIRNSGGQSLQRPSLRIEGDGAFISCDSTTNLAAQAASECLITIDRGHSEGKTAKLLTTESPPELSTIRWREEE